MQRRYFMIRCLTFVGAVCFGFQEKRQVLQQKVRVYWDGGDSVEVRG